MQSVRQAVMGFMERNRLASNSLLEALVFAKAAAKDITEHPSKSRDSRSRFK